MTLAYRPKHTAPLDPFLRRLYVRTLRQAYMLGMLDLHFSEEEVPAPLVEELIARASRVA